MNNTINKTINKTIKLIEESNLNSIKYSPVYMFTTENIKGVMNSIDVENKQILTVSSSGDQIFNMLLHGATAVETYDINHLTKYYFYLKEAALKTLTYKEFLDFFFTKPFSYNNKVFENEVFFKKIMPNIKNEQAKHFWTILFSRYSGKNLYKSNLFINNNFSKNTYKECNEYLKNETNYKTVQKRLSSYEYNFHWMNMFENIDLPNNKKYDIIYLSNILDRMTYNNDLKCAKKIKEILEQLKIHLKDNGLISVCYLYLYLEDYWQILSPSQITNPYFRSKYFDEDDYTYKSFNGFSAPKNNSLKNKDAIMLVRKK